MCHNSKHMSCTHGLKHSHGSLVLLIHGAMCVHACVHAYVQPVVCVYVHVWQHSYIGCLEASEHYTGPYGDIFLYFYGLQGR